jgi:cytochrome c-type biogenesis protein CcmE
MKKIHFIAIGLMVVAIGLLISASKEMGTYSTFEEARQTNKKVKLVGQLAKDKEMYYNPEEDPNYFSFYVKDMSGEEQKVVLLKAKPQDFELSEQIVLIGKLKEESFVAEDVLMKCPSKYKEEEISLRG